VSWISGSVPPGLQRSSAACCAARIDAIAARASLFRASETWTPPAISRGLLYVCQNTRERERMEKFAHYGTILHLGLGPEVSEEKICEKARGLMRDREKRQRMSDAGARLVDAQGASRVYEVMKKAGNKGPANGGRWL